MSLVINWHHAPTRFLYGPRLPGFGSPTSTTTEALPALGEGSRSASLQAATAGAAPRVRPGAEGRGVLGGARESRSMILGEDLADHSGGGKLAIHSPIARARAWRRAPCPLSGDAALQDFGPLPLN
jgi:hypothetical protein